jgi:hypothetical protein
MPALVPSARTATSATVFDPARKLTRSSRPSSGDALAVLQCVPASAWTTAPLRSASRIAVCAGSGCLGDWCTAVRTGAATSSASSAATAAGKRLARRDTAQTPAATGSRACVAVVGGAADTSPGASVAVVSSSPHASTATSTNGMNHTM